MTVPNLITSIRIILTPIFVIYLIDDKYLAALIVFIIAGISDAADGLIARVFNQKSKLGATLDPIADKILLIAAFIVLSVKNFIPPWLSVIVISRDILILLAVLILFLNKITFTMQPSFISKITTCLQLTAIFSVLIVHFFPVLLHVNVYLFWITGFFTIISFLFYLRQWFHIMGDDTEQD